MSIGLNQQIWGPGTWLFLHSVTLNYPDNPTEEDKERIISFFKLVGQVLPCRYCRNNFSLHTRKYPIRCESREALVYWLIDVHNMANLTLGKSVDSREDCLKKLICLYQKEKQNPYSLYIIYIFIAFIMLFVIYFCRFKNI